MMNLHGMHFGSILCLIAWSVAANAQSAAQPLVKLPQEIEFKGSPLPTAELFGDPTKPELYVQRAKIPAGFKLPPHWHPDDRTVVVLSGTLYYGFGDQWDEKKLTALPTGSFFTEPSHLPHFAWAKDGEVVLQVSAIGPSGATLVPQQAK